MQERLARAGAAQAKALVMRTHVSILEREPEKLPPRFRKAAVAQIGLCQDQPCSPL